MNPKAHQLANRILGAGATDKDLLPAVTERMMKNVGERAGGHLRRERGMWETNLISDYKPPRAGTQWTICVKRDLTVETIEVEYSILRLRTIELIDHHDREPVPPFLVTEVAEPPSLATTLYRQTGNVYGFPLLLAQA
jgi:hypothetical protein